MSDYVVQPSAQAGGSVRVPGDKSISHRALMLGSIAEGITEVRGFLESEDCLATMKAMRALGVRIEQTGAQEVRVHGVGYGDSRRRARRSTWAIPARRCG